MLTFERRRYDASGNQINDTETFASEEHAAKFMQSLFESDCNAAIFEGIQHASGKFGFSVKDRTGKIIYSIKTIEE